MSSILAVWRQEHERIATTIEQLEHVEAGDLREQLRVLRQDLWRADRVVHDGRRRGPDASVLEEHGVDGLLDDDAGMRRLLGELEELRRVAGEWHVVLTNLQQSLVDHTGIARDDTASRDRAAPRCEAEDPYWYL